MKAVTIHNTTGTTKICEFEAPVITRQLVDAGIIVMLHEETGGPLIGGAMFHKDGLVLLVDLAIDQYGPLSRPST